NQISEVPLGDFGKLKYLKDVYLHGNKLAPEVLEHLGSKYNIRMESEKGRIRLCTPPMVEMDVM
ncbi:hypothetical protein ILUMI_17668, partial [Ignelater luminosus]